MTYQSWKNRVFLLYRWAYCFFIATILLSIFIGAKVGFHHILPLYHSISPCFSFSYRVWLWILFAVFWFAQITLLAGFCFLILLAVISLCPNRWIIFPIAILLNTFLLLALWIDSVASSKNHLRGDFFTHGGLGFY